MNSMMQRAHRRSVSLCNQLHNSANDDLCNQLHKPLDDRVAFYADAARSSATNRAYTSDMAAFTAWGGQVPASPETVASYLAASGSAGRRNATASSGGHCRRPPSLGHPDPTKHALVRKVFRGIRRVHGARVDAATPLDIDMLARIIVALPHDIVAVRDRALLLVGFFCALRRSELVGLTVERPGPTARRLDRHYSTQQDRSLWSWPTRSAPGPAWTVVPDGCPSSLARYCGFV